MKDGRLPIKLIHSWSHAGEPKYHTVEGLQQIETSIKAFGLGFLKLRPILLTQNFEVIDGKLRLEYLIKAGYTHLEKDWFSIHQLNDQQVEIARMLTNTHYGRFNFEQLLNKYSDEELQEYGLFCDQSFLEYYTSYFHTEDETVFEPESLSAIGAVIESNLTDSELVELTDTLNCYMEQNGLEDFATALMQMIRENGKG